MEENKEMIQPTEDVWKDVTEGNFVTFEDGEERTLGMTNWYFEDSQFKDADGVPNKQLVADVYELDGKSVTKKLSNSSKPLLRALKPILLGLDNTTRVKVRVTRLGDGKNTNYAAKKVE